ncbi:MAG TPA: KR domain-containing protein, partial [Sinorhizobium sp.]|nr:KR domain-containing protein [Sinorhizobium sp.]
MTGRPGILIVGGYGHVGIRIARWLIDGGSASVVIGGRQASKAAAAARRLGCSPAVIDIADAASWADALAG